MNGFLQGTLVGAVAVAMLAGCTTDVTEKKGYISISDSQITLLGNGSEAQMVTILDAPGEITVETGASWLHTSDIVDNVLSVTADPNDAASDRSTEIRLTSGEATATIKVRQLGADALGVHYRYLNDYRFSAISPNGRWIGAIREEFTDDGEQGFIPAVIDTETNELTEFEIIRTSACNIQDLNCVSNDGKMFVFNSNHTSTGIIDLRTGELSFPKGLENTEEINWNGRIPDITATSEDASIWVGYQFRNALGFLYRPVMVVNGEPQLLPMPETDAQGRSWPENYNGLICQGISPDGKVIWASDYGSDNGGTVYWTAEDNYSTPHWLTDENGNITGGGFSFSPNCELVSVGGKTYNLADGSEYPYGVSSISNDGWGFSGNSVVNVFSGATMPMSEWISENFEGLTLPGDCIVSRLSTDGRVLSGIRPEQGVVQTKIFGWYAFKDVQ